MAATKLDQFYSDVFKTGIARSNRYEVILIPPAGNYSSLSSSGLLRHMTLVTESIEIPSQTISTAESKINGLPVVPVPNGFSYTNILNMSFRLSADYRERNMLLLWQDMVYKPGKGFSYYNDYVGTIVVKPLDDAERSYQEFIFRNCYPVAIQELQYGWGSNNDYLKQGVTFSFYSAETQTSSTRSSDSGNAQNSINLQNLLNSNLTNNLLGSLLNNIFR